MVEAEIHEARKDSSGGFKGSAAEVARPYAGLTDPQIAASLSPPFDFDMADLCNDEVPVHLYLILPEEQIDNQAAVLKSLYVRMLAEKQRRPGSGRILAVIDEAGQFAREGFDLLPKLYSFGAGIGIQPFAVFQNAKQMAGIAKGAEQLLPASAGCYMRFAIRELDSARHVSAMIGDQTLRHADDLTQVRASEEEWQLAQVLLSGADPFAAVPKLRLKAYEKRHSIKIRRNVLTPDEVLRMQQNKMVVFADGLPGPILADRQPYWTVPKMAGRYHPNPYHPPYDKVPIAAELGERWRPVIREPVPQQFAHLPQYADGTWSRIGDEDV